MNQLMTLLWVLSVAWLGYLFIDYVGANSDVIADVAFNTLSVFHDNPIIMFCIGIVLLIQGVSIGYKLVVMGGGKL